MTSIPADSMAGVAEAAPRTTVLARYENFLLGAGAVTAFLAFWQAAVAWGWANPLFTSSPTRIVVAAMGMIADGSLWNNLAVSGWEFTLGFGLAVLVGVPMGILMGWYRRLNALFDPFVSALYSTPRIALMPLVIIWFGIDLSAKVAIIFLSTVFPVLVNTMTGVRTVDRDFVKVARSFGASDRQLFLTVALPSSVPNLLTGLRLGLGHALIGIVVGEMYGASAGIGFMIQSAGATFQTDKVMVGIIIIAAAGVLLTQILKMIEARYEVWRVPTHG